MLQRINTLIANIDSSAGCLKALVQGSAAEQHLLQEILTKLSVPSIPAARKNIFTERLAASGVSIVRDFLDENETTELKQLVGQIYSAMDNAGDLSSIDPDFEKNFRTWRGVWLEPLPRFLPSDLARRFEHLATRIQDCVRDLFGHEWTFYPARSYFRRHEGAARMVPWHIDADAAALAKSECINIWLPLDRVGTDLPSLDVVPHSHLAMRAVPLITDNDRWRDDAFVEKIGPFMAPVMAPGDAMAFDQYTLHRTQQVGGTGLVRTACEFRFSR